MEFRFQDIIKNIVPGAVIVLAFTAFLINDMPTKQWEAIMNSPIKEYEAIMAIGALLIFYLVGYCLDAISSVLEYYLIHTLVGRPSYKLLSGKGSRIALVNYDEIIAHIQAKYPNDHTLRFSGNSKTDKKIAKKFFRYANILRLSSRVPETNSLIREYYYSYIFSRNFFFAISIVSISVVVHFHRELTFIQYSVMAFILVLLYIRRRDHDYYHSRQILIEAVT